MLQSLASALCQIFYIVWNVDLSDPTVSATAKGLFGANISVSLLGVIIGLVMLFMKQQLLAAVEVESEEIERKKAEDKEIAQKNVDEVTTLTSLPATNGGHSGHKNNDSIEYTTNPMMCKER